jgi:hypothetical protein
MPHTLNRFALLCPSLGISTESMLLEVLDFAFMLLGLFQTRKRAKVFTLSGGGVLLA